MNEPILSPSWAEWLRLSEHFLTQLWTLARLGTVLCNFRCSWTCVCVIG